MHNQIQSKTLKKLLLLVTSNLIFVSKKSDIDTKLRLGWRNIRLNNPIKLRFWNSANEHGDNYTTPAKLERCL